MTDVGVGTFWWMFSSAAGCDHEPRARRRIGVLLAGVALTATACASSGPGDGAGPLAIPGQDGVESVSLDEDQGGDDPTTTGDDSTTGDGTIDGGVATDPAVTTTDGSAPGEPSSTQAPAAEADPTTTSSTTTTTTVPEPDVYDPLCVVEVRPGDSLGSIADTFDDPTVNVSTIRAENDVEGDTIFAGQLLDVCVDNGLDDETGEERAQNAALVQAGRIEAVKRQQEKLNELFDGTGMRELLVDGVSGPVTRQRLCAARAALGLDVTRDDMEPESPEEATLLAAESLVSPFTTALLSERWILIDRTCQVLFTGEADRGIVHVFPTSTGSEGFETRDQDRSRVYRFDPSLENGGWHNSTDYPVPEDNPLNGNMYKPLYFDGGQAIHGANNVPTTPQSKGCARLSPANQDALIAWLGLADASGPTNDSGRINATVNVRGSYADPAPLLEEA